MANWIFGIIATIFGVLFTAIGVLVYARLVYLTVQIDELFKINRQEVAARETRWKIQTEKCADENGRIGRLIGVLNGKGIVPSGFV